MIGKKTRGPARKFAPFTLREIRIFNIAQTGRVSHGYTCMGHNGCKEDNKLLHAKTDGLVCPCGKYSQRWCYGYSMGIRDVKKVKRNHMQRVYFSIDRFLMIRAKNKSLIKRLYERRSTKTAS